MKKQQISEIVGSGHPDLIADSISKLIGKIALVSATEVIVNDKGVYASGETQFENQNKEWEAKKEVKMLLEEVCFLYGRQSKKIKVWFNFKKQIKMLSDQRQEKKAGDQEVVYFNVYNENDVHKKLQEIKKNVDTRFKLWDYKILVNEKNNTLNISFSRGYRYANDAILFLVSFLNVAWPRKTFKYNFVGFDGGSVFNDTGVTGRKLIAERQGCGYPHGGGAIWGKDKTKTAPYGMEIARIYAEKNNIQNGKSVVLVYFPGDDLNKPNFIGVDDEI